MIEILKENYLVLIPAILGLLEVIVRLTPTEKDNSVLEWIKKLLNIFIPNNKKDGGTH